MGLIAVTWEFQPWFSLMVRNKLLTAEEAAEFLDIRVGTLAQWRSQGRGPRYIKIEGRLVRYRLADLEAYLEEHLVPLRS